MLVLRGSLSLLRDAGPTLGLNPSEAGVSHESLKLLNAVKSPECRVPGIKKKKPLTFTYVWKTCCPSV